MKGNGMKRLVALLLAIVLAVLAFGGCGATMNKSSGGAAEQSNASDDSDLKAVNPVTLDFFVDEHPNWPLSDDTPVLKAMAEKTGVKIHWIPAPDASFNEKLNVVMASGELPDIMSMDSKNLNNYATKGAFYDMGELVDKYSTNIKKFMTPGAIMTVLNGDRKYYGIPGDTRGKQQVRITWLVRKDWMAKLGITKDPDNIDEYEAMLRAFKNSDMDGNGKKDTIPLCNRHGETAFMETTLFAPQFGMTPTDPPLGITMGKDGKLFFNATSDNMKSLLIWLNKLYKEGLLDKEYPTRSSKQWEEAVSSSMVGATVDYASRGDSLTLVLQKQDPNAVFGPIKPIAGPNGDRGVSCYEPYYDGDCTAITKDCKDVEAAMRFLDFWYSDEGALLTNCGVKGSSYTEIKDGKAEWVDEIEKDKSNMAIWAKFGFGQRMISVRTDVPYADDLYFGKYSLEAISLNKDYYALPMPNVNLKKEEADRAIELSSQLSPAILQYYDKFITGQVSLSEWDKYVAEIKRLGLDEYMKIQSDAYARLNDDRIYVENTYKQ